MRDMMHCGKYLARLEEFPTKAKFYCYTCGRMTIVRLTRRPGVEGSNEDERLRLRAAAESTQ